MKQKRYTKEMLMPFVLNTENNSPLKNVFLQHGYVVASDSHVLIRIPKDMMEDLSAIPEQHSPNVEGVIPAEMLLNRPISKIRIENALAKTPKVAEKKECEDCHGMGKVEYTYTSQDDDVYSATLSCPVCKGRGYLGETGKMVPDPRQLYHFCGGLMNPESLRDILRVMDALGEKKLYIRATDDYKVTFTVNDIQILKAFVVIEEDDDEIKPYLGKIIHII